MRRICAKLAIVALVAPGQIDDDGVLLPPSPEP